MANFALNYSFSRNLNIPLDEDAVKALRSDVITYVETKSKCYAGQLFSVTGDTAENNGLYIAVTTGENALVVKLASQDALDAVAASAGKIDKIQLNGTDLTINDKVVNIDLSTYATIEYVDSKVGALSDVYAPKAEFEALNKKVDEITSVGGEPNVQSDWNVESEDSDAFIKNKPDLTVYSTKSELNDAQTAIAEDIKDAIDGLAEVYAPKAVVETLVGEDVDKSARAIAAEEVAKIVASADTDFDTLKEIADWILSDTTGAAQMANDIANLKAVSADTRLEALEADQHVHENKEVLDGISADKVAAWDAAEQNAKDYADGKETAIHTWVEEKNYLTEHQDISNLATKTEVLDAEGRASAYTDAEISKLSEVYDAKGDAAKAQTAATASAKEYTDTEIGKLGNTYATTASVDTIKTTLENKIATDIKALEEVYDIKGAAAGALGEAKVYAEGLAINYDKAGDAAKALADAKAYADSLAEDYDVAGAAVQALKDAKEYADGLAGNYDAAGSAAAAQAAAEAYADGLAGNYDAAGAAVSAAASALTDAKNFTTSEIAKLSEVYDAKGAAAGAAESALTEAKAYADGLAVNYDAAGSAAQALEDAKEHVTETLKPYATKSYVDDVLANLEGGNIELGGYAKIEDVTKDIKDAKDEVYASAVTYADGKFQEKGDYETAGAAAQALEDAKAYVDAISANTRLEVLEAIDHDKLVADAIAEVVASADTSFDTLKEIADWILNDTTGAASMANDIADLKAISADTRLEALEAISGQSHIHENKEVLDGISADKVAAWDAAEQNAKDYADGLAGNYDAAGSAAAAQAAAEAYADGLAGNYDAAGAAESALTEAKSYADGLVENIKPYEGGVATSIAMGENETYVVDVKVAADTENKKNFLDVNGSNELEVTEITLDVAKTSKEIVVEGGAWESIVKPIFGSSVPAGTTWESFLEAMLCVEKFPGTISTSSAFTVSCGNINPGIDKSGTVEVGTVVTLNKTVANDTTASQSISVGTFSGDGKVYGYKLGEKGAHVSSKTYSETLTPTLKTSSKALKVTFSGFVDAVNSGSAITTKTGEGEIAAVTMYAMSGTNKVTVYQTGDTYTSSSAVTAGTIYAATNLKNYYKSDKVTPNTHTPSCPAVDKTANDSTEYSVTGAFKYFVGDVTEYAADYWDTDRSSVVRGLKTQDWATASTISVAHTFKVGTKQQAVVVPSKYTSVAGKDVNNGDVTFNLVKTFDFTNAQGYISSYKVFVAPAADGLGSDSKITITIK